MKVLSRLMIAVFVLTATIAGPLSVPRTQAAPTAPARHVYLPYSSNSTARDVARAFDSDESGVLATGGGHILSVGPDSVPTYQNGSAATISLSVDVSSSPPAPPPAWLNIVSQPVTFGPENFVFDFPLTVRMPLAGVDDVSDLFFVRYNAAQNAWTRSLLAFNPDANDAVETTLFTLGAMAVGTYDVTAAAMHPQGGLYVPNTHCPIGGRNCFYYLTIKSFTPKYADEAPAGSFVGNVLRLRSNVTGESPEPTGWLLPQGTYSFCYSALESPLTLTSLEKYINPNAETVTINEPYACSSTFTCKTEIHPINREGWIKATDNRPCGMGGALAPTDPATLGATGDFQATLTWINTDGNATDLDLHLYGPNGLHVYYRQKTAGTAVCVSTATGNPSPGMRSRIFSRRRTARGTSIPMPSGSYSLRVHHYAGADNKAYQVRVIRNGTVSNFSGVLSYEDERELMTFTVP